MAELSPRNAIFKLHLIHRDLGSTNRQYITPALSLLHWPLVLNYSIYHILAFAFQAFKGVLLLTVPYERLSLPSFGLLLKFTDIDL